MIAKEFLYDKAGDYILMSKDKVEKLLIEFAQYHVEQALKEVSENIDYGYTYTKESVLTAYPKEKIQ